MKINLLNKTALILLFIMSSIFVKGQEKKQLNFGISGGYKLNSGCFSIDYGLIKNMTIGNTFSLDKYMGFGVGLAMSYFPLQDTKFNLFVGTSLTYTFGTQFSYGEDDIPTIFKVSKMIYLTPNIGLKYDDIGENVQFKNYFSYFLQLGWKFGASGSPHVEYVSGPQLPDRFNKIENYIGNSLVGSIGIILNVPKRRPSN